MLNTKERTAGKTVSTTYIRIITNELERLGYTRAHIDDALGIPDIPRDSIGYIPFFDANELWHKALQLTKDPLFSMRAARSIHPADFGLLGFLGMHCDTIGNAWKLAYRYQDIIADGFISKLIIKNDTIINRMDCLNTPPEWSRPYVEHDFVALLMILRFGTANLRPDIQFTLHFTHQPVAPINEYKKIYNADYHFGMEHNQIVFPAEVLDLPVYSANKDLFELLLKKIDKKYEALKNKNGLAHELAILMEEQLLTNRPVSLESCSSHFHISTSTLKRRLLENGTTYQDILSNTKLKIARKMLENENIRISHIAHTLGYSSVSQFTRFLKSKTGQSPTEYRERENNPVD